MTHDATLTIVMTDKFDRKCGECQLCCRLLPMTPYPPAHVADTVDHMIAAGWAKPADFAGMLHEWEKPAGKSCEHQRHGKGCKVYSRRPFGCRYWNCQWLTGTDTADLRRPDRSRYVVDMLPDFVTLRPNDGTEPTNIEVVQVWCDPHEPDAWRDQSLLAYIERRAAEGKAAIVRFGNKRAVVVFAPSMSQDGQWHEVHHGELRPQHLGAELIAGLTSARKVKVE
jgi:Putative zinc- or iron-chelating domain